MKTQMIILAGGSGLRFGGELPKQFIKIAGKTIIEHTIAKIENCQDIDSMIIVVSREYQNYMKELIVKNFFKKVKQIILGGDSRQESSYAGIEACDIDTDNVLFHDAIRPFISEQVIVNMIKALGEYEAVDVAIPCADTIIQVNQDKIITDIPERKYLMRGQTPQGFRLSLIKKAYQRYLQDDQLTVTDDCGIIVAYEMADVYVVMGEEKNIKITYKEDAYLADKLFQINAMELTHEIEVDELLESLKDKVGVIIGHTSGIGKDIYDLLKKRLGCIYGYSRQNGMDISDYKKVEETLSYVNQQEGRIDYIINTSGELAITKLEDMSIEAIIQMNGTNFLGSVNITKAALPYMKKSKGHILLFTSSSYTRGREMYSIYSATKAAIVNFAQAISEEVFEDGIRINVMNPERTDTPMRRNNFGEEPRESLLTCREVAIETLRVVMSGVTGQVVDVRKIN